MFAITLKYLQTRIFFQDPVYKCAFLHHLKWTIGRYVHRMGEECNEGHKITVKIWCANGIYPKNTSWEVKASGSCWDLNIFFMSECVSKYHLKMYQMYFVVRTVYRYFRFCFICSILKGSLWNSKLVSGCLFPGVWDLQCLIYLLFFSKGDNTTDSKISVHLKWKYVKSFTF